MTEFATLYQQELQALIRDGTQFAAGHPQLTRGLTGAARNPDVERLLQGVAFLTARQRQLHDDQYPQLLQRLLLSLYPAALQSFPSAAVIALKPAANAGFEHITVPAGSLVAAEDGAGGEYRFRTTASVKVRSVQLRDCHLLPDRRGVELSLRLVPGSDNHGVWRPPERLHLFINRPPSQAMRWYRLLLSRVTSAELTFKGRGFTRIHDLVLPCFRAAGMDLDQALLPGAEKDVPLLRLMREYFCFREKFMFVELPLPPLPSGKAVDELREIHCRFGLREPPDLMEGLQIDDELLVPDCVPVINLYPASARPFLRDRPGGEWPLEVDTNTEREVRIFDVMKVSGIPAGHHQAHDFRLDVDAALDQGPQGGPVCSRECHPDIAGAGMRWSLSFPPTPTMSEPAAPASWYMSVDLLCSDGAGPRFLPPGDIKRGLSEGLEYLQMRSLTPVSETWPAPRDLQSGWAILDGVLSGRGSLADLEALRDTLLLANVPARQDAALMDRFRHRLQALLGLDWQPRIRQQGGACLSGRCCRLMVDSEGLGGEDEVFLFSSVLAHALAAQAPVNTLSDLELLDSASEPLLCWHVTPVADIGEPELWPWTR